MLYMYLWVFYIFVELDFFFICVDFEVGEDIFKVYYGGYVFECLMWVSCKVVWC